MCMRRDGRRRVDAWDEPLGLDGEDGPRLGGLDHIEVGVSEADGAKDVREGIRTTMTWRRWLLAISRVSGRARRLDSERRDVIDIYAPAPGCSAFLTDGMIVNQFDIAA